MGQLGWVCYSVPTRFNARVSRLNPVSQVVSDSQFFIDKFGMFRWLSKQSASSGSISGQVSCQRWAQHISFELFYSYQKSVDSRQAAPVAAPMLGRGKVLMISSFLFLKEPWTFLEPTETLKRKECLARCLVLASHKATYFHGIERFPGTHHIAIEVTELWCMSHSSWVNRNRIIASVSSDEGVVRKSPKRWGWLDLCEQESFGVLLPFVSLGRLWANDCNGKTHFTLRHT